MQDYLMCPMCQKQFSNFHHTNYMLFPINKIANYTRRICRDNFSHVLSFFTDPLSQEIDYLQLSLFSSKTNSFSIIIENNYYNNSSKLTLWGRPESHIISFETVLSLDFPSLTILKEKIKLYEILS
jgi:hypothetical protein